jgi:hypothetical protein
MQRLNQRKRILELLRSHDGAWVPLPEILDLQVAQYGARILELRRAGYQIENRQEGEHSWFRLIGFTAPAPAPNQPQSAQGELFAAQHKDLG